MGCEHRKIAWEKYYVKMCFLVACLECGERDEFPFYDADEFLARYEQDAGEMTATFVGGVPRDTEGEAR